MYEILYSKIRKTKVEYVAERLKHSLFISVLSSIINDLVLVQYSLE